MLEPGDVALCRESGYDPDIWFPDPASFRAIGKSQDVSNREVTKHTLLAMELCSRCDIAQKCIAYAMSDPDSMDYGIYGGTLPDERRSVVGMGRGAQGNQWQIVLRKLATKRGIFTPVIPETMERPKKLFAIKAKDAPQPSSEW